LIFLLCGIVLFLLIVVSVQHCCNLSAEVNVLPCTFTGHTSTVASFNIKRIRYFNGCWFVCLFGNCREVLSSVVARKGVRLQWLLIFLFFGSLIKGFTPNADHFCVLFWTYPLLKTLLPVLSCILLFKYIVF
ncbi:MAG: hypothetical protein ACRCTJ_02510, partial [Brevinema sp.]